MPMASHAEEAFDPEPIRELPDDEPRTPMWLPAVGAVLLLLVGCWWALGGDDDPAAAASAKASGAASVAGSAPRGIPRAAARPERDVPVAVDGQRKEALRKRLEQLREQREQGKGRDQKAAKTR